MVSYYDELEIEDFAWDEKAKVFHYPCPCGDRFEISKSQLRNGEEIAICPSCSLIVRVIYDYLDWEDYASSEEEDEDAQTFLSAEDEVAIESPNSSLEFSPAPVSTEEADKPGEQRDKGGDREDPKKKADREDDKSGGKDDAVQALTGLTVKDPVTGGESQPEAGKSESPSSDQRSTLHSQE